MGDEREKVLKRATRLHKGAERLAKRDAAPWCIECHARMKRNQRGFYCPRQCDPDLGRNPWCLKCKTRMGAAGLTANKIQRWRCRGCCFTVTETYQSGRWGRMLLTHRKPDKFAAAMILFKAGLSGRQVEKILHVSKVIAMRYRKVAIEKFDCRCQCGKVVGHNGFCSLRYKNSPKRQEFMRRWHTDGV